MAQWLTNHLLPIQLWIGTFCTLALYSILYKENKLYRTVEHIYLGLATGYTVATIWIDQLYPKLWTPLWTQGKWWYVFTVFVGLFYYLIYSRSLNWVARLTIGFFLGVTSGRAFQEFTNDIWPQIPKTFKPILPHAANAAGPALNFPDALNNLIFMIIVVCVMSYFFFSFEQKSPVLRNSAKSGRWLMMFAFGAIFGSTIMARLALLIDRMDFLINDFGPQVGGPKAGPVVMFLLLAALTCFVIYLATRPANRQDEAGISRD